MDERCRLPDQAPSATLIAVDGSQSYPSVHYAFTYYLLSTGSMVLQEGVGQAPATESRVIVRYPQQEGEAWQDRIPDRTQVNAERDQLEFRTLADLARAERLAAGPEQGAVGSPRWSNQPLPPESAAVRTHESRDSARSSTCSWPWRP